MMQPHPEASPAGQPLALQRRGRRLVLSSAGAVVALLTCAAVAAAAAAGDAVRSGPADGPRAKNQRTPATNPTSRLSDFWAESPRISVPNQGAVIPGSYIVVFRPGTPGSKDLAQQITADNGGKLNFSYGHALLGFAGSFSEDKIEKIRNHPNVISVEQDRVVGAEDTQTGATWGLDRIDQRNLPLDGSYTDGTEGAGVNAYIIDTGIRLTHTEFTGRIGNGYDAVTAGGNASDCNGHGTHVSSTVGGTTYGVADKVRLHPVRVLDCGGSGTNAGVIAGVDWVKANAIKPAVANMSLGGSASSALDTAVANAIASGVTFAIAAGNSNLDACSTSPARTPSAITVGATTNTDNRASFSNFGTCLDIFAPGQNITAAWSTSDTATNTISGTSMASPHVAGAAALQLSASPTSTPQQVRDAIVNSATAGLVIGPGTGSPNRLLFTGTGVAPPPPPPSNILVNPGFENGTTGWTQSSSGGYALIDSSKPHTGSYGVYLGGYNSATETINQTVTVPSNGVLRYWWQMTSSEGTGTAYDYLRVQLYDATTGAFITTLRTWSNVSTRNVWSQDTISVAGYAGRRVRVQFAASTDSSILSSFYVDDTSLGS